MNYPVGRVSLHLLGGAGLTSADGSEVSSVPAQPKRFALLVYLTLGGAPRMQRRDTLLAMFWSDSDEERACGLLRSSSSVRRRRASPPLAPTCRLVSARITTRT